MSDRRDSVLFGRMQFRQPGHQSSFRTSDSDRHDQFPSRGHGRCFLQHRHRRCGWNHALQFHSDESTGRFVHQWLEWNDQRNTWLRRGRYNISHYQGDGFLAAFAAVSFFDTKYQNRSGGAYHCLCFPAGGSGGDCLFCDYTFSLWRIGKLFMGDCFRQQPACRIIALERGRDHRHTYGCRKHQLWGYGD